MAVHQYSRDKLEENRRKQAAAQAAAQKALQSGAAYKGANAANKAQKTIFGQSAPTVTKPSTAAKSTKPAQSTPNKITITPGASQNTRTQAAIKNDNSRRAVAARNREAQRIQQNNDHQTLQLNQIKWHQTSDPAQKAQLHQQNNEIRGRLGLNYVNGVTYTNSGKNLSLGAQMLYGKGTERNYANRFSTALQSKEMNAPDKTRITERPTLYQTAQGVTADDLAGQTGANAHKAMRDLFNRSDSVWSEQDTAKRDKARQELTNEMSRIFEHYGLTYVPRDGDTATVMRQLRAAGADNKTLAYVQENIDLRDAADRLGEGMEAVGKRWAASIPSLVDTARQTSANVEESRQSSEYKQLEEQEQQLELQLQGIPSTDADGRVSAEYQAVYDQLQAVKERKNQLTVSKGVDPNKWSQRMLREANQAQMNAEAGLSAAPRWLTEQGISLAGNAPTMAASAIPVVGPVLGSAVIGAQAAGQRAFELNERGVPARESLVRGLTSGAIEAATEKLPLEQMANILHSGGTGAVRSILRQMGVEAGEESASYFLNYVADKAAADPDAKFSLAELVQSAAGGAFGGLVFGTAGALGAHMVDEGATRAANAYEYQQNQVQEILQADSEMRAAMSLPEGPVREYAIQTAQEKLTQKISDMMVQQAAENAELNASYDADLNSRMMNAQQVQSAEWEQQHTTSIDTNPATHTPEQMVQIREYVNSVDEGLLSYVEHVQNNPQSTERYMLDDMSERAANDIREKVGVDVRGFKTTIEPRIVEHIIRDHGENGLADHSMADTNDIARIQYVLNNYDTVVDGGTSNAYTEPKPNYPGKNRKAKTVVFEKKIDGSYYVVEAVPVTKAKTAYVTSAYINTNKKGNQPTLNAPDGTPGFTSENASLSSLAAQQAPDVQASGHTSKTALANAAYDEGSKIPIAPNDVSGSTQGTASMIPQDETMSFMTGTREGYPSDTASPDNSISPNAENSNTSGENIPLNEAMQYGKTPEQAMMEAEARAEGERVQQAAERPEMMEARRIAERLGAKFEVADLGAAGGKYENGTITINPYTDNPVRQVLVHELTHHLENSGVYNDLQTAALRAFSEEQGVSADVLRRNITNLYAQKGVTLDLDSANRELTAAFCENRLFQDEDSINRLAQTDRNLFQRIRQWISDIVIRLRGTAEQKRILEVQRLYEKAAQNVGAVQDRGAQYKILRGEDGTDFVQATSDVVDGVRGSGRADLYDIVNIQRKKIKETLKPATTLEAQKPIEGSVSSDNSITPDSANSNTFGFTPEQTAKGEVPLNEAMQYGKTPEQAMMEANARAEGERVRQAREAQQNPAMQTADSDALGTQSDDSGYRQSKAQAWAESVPNPLGEYQQYGKSADRAVFAEDAGTTAEIKYPVYTPEAIHENQRKLRDMQPVTKLTGNEFAKGDTDLMTQVLNYFDSLGNSVYSEQFGDVALTKSSWRSERRHGMTALKANTFAAVPDVIRNGVVIDYMQKRDGAVDRIVAAAPIQIGTDADYYVGVMLQRDQQSQRLYLHDVVALKNQGQKNKTQTWHQNPDVSRSSSNLDISSILRNTLDGNTSVQNTFGFTPEQIAKGTVALNEAMQYGKTPEQAMMEANARAEGERVRQAREAQQNPAMQTADSDALGTQSDDSGYRQSKAQAWAESVPNPLGEYQQYGKSKETAMQELQRKLSEKRSFLYDMDSKQVRAVQSAELREAWELARPVQEQIEKFKERHPLSDREEQLIQAALVNGSTERFADCEDPTAMMHLYQMQKDLRQRMEPIREYQQARREILEMNAEEMADNIAEFAKDKKIPGAYSRETMERNSFDIFGKNNRAYAEHLNDEYFTPVHKAVADRTNYVNTMREQVANLHLDKHESALVQMALEGRNDAAAEYMKNNNIKVTSELQKHVADGVATFQAIYKELYEAINETLLSNGMEPVRARKNYAPHFVKDKPDTTLARIRFMFGWGKDSTLNINTDIAGITDDFKPGKKWFGNLLQREGKKTDYDAVAGFDRYIETAGDVIFLTDSVQNLRSLEDALRYRLSDEGTRKKVNEIRSNINLNALQRHQQIEQAYDVNADNIQTLYNQRKQGMGGYVANLHEYINNLAGKKARADRGWEELIGRQVYNVAKNVEGRVAANMIALNPGSWVTNFIPITQASGEVSTANLIKAMRDTVKSAVKDDGFTDGSVFLTNREGTQYLDRTLTRKVSDIAGMPMEAIDHFTSNVVTRAKYLQNIQDGMSVSEAFDNADSFAANLMADRSKGAQPTAFNSVNPIRKVFTMFQLEVNNQLSYLFKDLPRAQQNKAKLAWAYTKVFTGAYLFNAVYHQLTGRDSAFDPIGMIADAFGIGDDDDKDKKPVDIALNLGENVAEQLPFIGGVLGGGRVPISAAFPDVGSLVEEYQNGYDSKRIARDAGKQLANTAAYLLLPFGGGALKKAVEGYNTVQKGGSYSMDKNGDTILQFPQYGQSPRDWAQAMLFGKSSLQSAQKWSENGYDSLNAKETKAYETLKDRMDWHGSDNSADIYAAIKAMKTITNEQGYGDVAANQMREMLMNNSALSAAQKDFLDRELVSGGTSGVYTSPEAFDISQNVRESRQAAAFEALKHGISVDEFVNWDSVIEQTLADNYVDAKDYTDGGDNQAYAKNTVLSTILDEYAKSGEYSDAEKQTFADYVIISAMEQSDRDKWHDEVQGKVSASDYVKFKGDLAAYKKEFTGTGADNAANVANILNSYTNLTEEQKSVLMNTYSESAKNDPFHVSEYEKKLADNSFYKDLNADGRTLIRTYCNEYEQAIADGKELSGWKAKAYMAKEAGIEPGTYALFQAALKANDYDGNGSYKAAEITAAVKCIPGLTDKQRGYLWQAAKGGKPSKNNPWGTTSVTAYTKTSDSAVNPVEGGTISSGFGPRNSPTEGASTAHKAIDIAAPLGTSVKAVMAGKVTMVYRGDYGGYGNTVEITHPNGLVTKYHHMQDGSLDNISVGQEVSAGQQIGKVGSTGISTGPHLDFQVEKDGDFVDPRKYIPGYGAGNDYVYSGSASAGTIASGKAAAASSGSKSGKSGSSGGSSSSAGLKKPKKPKGLG